MSTKYIDLFLAFLFVVFAVVQLNDPDPWAWVAMYLFIAGVCGFAAFGKSYEFVLGFGFGICLYWMIGLFPDFLYWIEMGTPNIASEMKTEQPHIELVREFLGLLICLVVLLYQLVRLKKETKDKLISQ